MSVDALAALDADLCPLPVATDGSKAPHPGGSKWGRYQTERPDVDTVRRWFSNGQYQGIGIVCGAISGGLEMLEFEGRAVEEHLDQRFLEAAEAAGLGELVARIAHGYEEESPSGGIHWLYRCTEIGPSTELAREPGSDGNPQVLIETRGEGGFTIIAPSNGSTHPSGKPWVRVEGNFTTIATITPEERAELHRLCSSFDAMPEPVRHIPPATARTDDGDRPGDIYNATMTWADVLEPHGWIVVYQNGAETAWRRPGRRAAGISATTNHLGTDTLKVFSSSTPFETEGTYDKFGAYAVLEHAGDLSAAARALRPAVPAATTAPSHPAPTELPEDGAALLNEVAAFESRFLACAAAGLDAGALWIAHTHTFEAAETSPRFAPLSAEPQSGKTRFLEVFKLLVRAPLFAVNISEAALFRVIEARRPTVLHDEIDAVFGPRAHDRENLRAMLNAGYERGATVERCVGEGSKLTVKSFPVFAPVAMAGIGKLPETVALRTIVVRMKRRAPTRPSRSCVGARSPPKPTCSAPASRRGPPRT